MSIPFPFRLAAALAFAAAATAIPAVADDAAPKAPHYSCDVPDDLSRLAHTLPRLSRRIAAGESLTVVAIGSSSTAGAGASSPAATYPSRLADELKARFPRLSITVLNRGVNGEEAQDMLARFDRDVVAAKPDLVLWQVGTNSVLRDHPVAPAGALIRSGLAQLKATGADVVLIDPQFAPKVIVKHDVDGMLRIIANEAKRGNVELFHRFAVMRHWREVAGMPFAVFVSDDELHMNDWSYACVAKLLAAAIADAATRSTVTASAKR